MTTFELASIKWLGLLGSGSTFAAYLITGNVHLITLTAIWWALYLCSHAKGAV